MSGHLSHLQCLFDLTEYQENVGGTREAAGSNPPISDPAKEAAASLFSSLLTGLPGATGSNQGEEEEKKDDQPETNKDEATDSCLPTTRPVQKNKKRCWQCRAKLELAQRELGTCKCGELWLCVVSCMLAGLVLMAGYVFCLLHRLPEQHDCIYDHKEGGRREALKNMVPAGRKKIGRSFHRMDSTND